MLLMPGTVSPQVVNQPRVHAYFNPVLAPPSALHRPPHCRGVAGGQRYSQPVRPGGTSWIDLVDMRGIAGAAPAALHWPRHCKGVAGGQRRDRPVRPGALVQHPIPARPLHAPRTGSHFLWPKRLRPLLPRPPFTRVPISAARRQAFYELAEKLHVCVHICTEEGGSHAGTAHRDRAPAGVVGVLPVRGPAVVSRNACQDPSLVNSHAGGQQNDACLGQRSHARPPERHGKSAGSPSVHADKGVAARQHHGTAHNTGRQHAQSSNARCLVLETLCMFAAFQPSTPAALSHRQAPSGRVSLLKRSASSALEQGFTSITTPIGAPAGVHSYLRLMASCVPA